MQYQRSIDSFILTDTPPEGFGQALVCFGDNGPGLWWMRVLKKGFRHCFVALHDGWRWIVIDPLLHRTHVSVPLADNGFDLAAQLREKGYTVVVCEVREPPLRMAPISISTCVEGVKRVLGIHNRWIVTPWQLYKMLIREKNLVKVKKNVDGSYLIR
jgi:hypothetical protein